MSIPAQFALKDFAASRETIDILSKEDAGSAAPSLSPCQLPHLSLIASLACGLRRVVGPAKLNCGIPPVGCPGCGATGSFC